MSFISKEYVIIDPTADRKNPLVILKKPQPDNEYDGTSHISNKISKFSFVSDRSLVSNDRTSSKLANLADFSRSFTEEAEKIIAMNKINVFRNKINSSG